MVKESHHDSDEHHDETRHSDHHERKHPFYAKKSVLFLAVLFFIVVFALIFFMHKSTGITQYNAMNQKSLAIREFGMANAPKIMGYFTSYGMLAGIIFGIFTLIISFIVYGIARIWKWNGATGLGIAVAYGLFTFYGYEFRYNGPGTVTWANGITAFLGTPLLLSGLVLTIAGAVIIYLTTRTGTKGAA